MNTGAQKIAPRSTVVATDSELPDGWANARVGEILTVNYGKGLRESDRIPGRFPVYGSNGVVGQHKSATTRSATIVIGRKGTVGAVHLSEGPCWPIDTTYFIDEFNGLNAKFVLYGLGSLGLSELDTSTAIPGLNRDDLYGQTLTLSPLAEQKRIVAKVEGLLTRVNASRERLSKVTQILKRFRQSLLAAACSGRLTEDWRERHKSGEWEDLKLSDVIESKPKNGYSAKPVNHKTSWKILTLTATTSGRFDARFFKYFDEPISKDSPFWLQPGDILVQRGNTIEYVGVPAIYDGPPNQFIYPDLMIRFRANRRVDTRFLYFTLSWDETRTYLRDRATGTAGSMPKINQATLIEVPIKLPPIQEQREIVRRVEALFKLADTIEERVQSATKRADKLTQAILAKAFRGELVPTEAELARREGRDYEPASVLLDRIRVKKDATTTGVRQTKGHRREIVTP
jgi:type I restriction enzyme, S subunit